MTITDYLESKGFTPWILKKHGVFEEYTISVKSGPLKEEETERKGFNELLGDSRQEELFPDLNPSIPLINCDTYRLFDSLCYFAEEETDAIVLPRQEGKYYVNFHVYEGKSTEFPEADEKFKSEKVSGPWVNKRIKNLCYEILSEDNGQIPIILVEGVKTNEGRYRVLSIDPEVYNNIR